MQRDKQLLPTEPKHQPSASFFVLHSSRPQVPGRRLLFIPDTKPKSPFHWAQGTLQRTVIGNLQRPPLSTPSGWMPLWYPARRITRRDYGEAPTQRQPESNARPTHSQLQSRETRAASCWRLQIELLFFQPKQECLFHKGFPCTMR